jgi:secondary thiamine-phosphate synthase enzyme
MITICSEPLFVNAGARRPGAVATLYAGSSWRYNRGMITLSTIDVSTQARNEIIDLTPRIQEIVAAASMRDGHVLVFVPGSTGALSTIEYEPGLLQDLPQLLEKLVPGGRTYRHDQTWHDGNGHSHLRATLIGPSLAVPFAQKTLLLGTWQQIVFMEFDNKPRRRRILVQLQGE